MRFSFSKTAFVISTISAGIFLACNSSDNASTTTETTDAPQTAATDPGQPWTIFRSIAAVPDFFMRFRLWKSARFFLSAELLPSYVERSSKAPPQIQFSVTHRQPWVCFWHKHPVYKLHESV